MRSVFSSHRHNASIVEMRKYTSNKYGIFIDNNRMCLFTVEEFGQINKETEEKLLVDGNVAYLFVFLINHYIRMQKPCSLIKRKRTDLFMKRERITTFGLKPHQTE